MYADRYRLRKYKRIYIYSVSIIMCMFDCRPIEVFKSRAYLIKLRRYHFYIRNVISNCHNYNYWKLPLAAVVLKNVISNCHDEKQLLLIIFKITINI